MELSIGGACIAVSLSCDQCLKLRHHPANTIQFQSSGEPKIKK